VAVVAGAATFVRSVAGVVLVLLVGAALLSELAEEAAWSEPQK
jgi:hypothetical protein